MTVQQQTLLNQCMGLYNNRLFNNAVNCHLWCSAGEWGRPRRPLETTGDQEDRRRPQRPMETTEEHGDRLRPRRRRDKHIHTDSWRPPETNWDHRDLQTPIDQRRQRRLPETTGDPQRPPETTGDPWRTTETTETTRDHGQTWHLQFHFHINNGWVHKCVRVLTPTRVCVCVCVIRSTSLHHLSLAGGGTNGQPLHFLLASSCKMSIREWKAPPQHACQCFVTLSCSH